MTLISQRCIDGGRVENMVLIILPTVVVIEKAKVWRRLNEDDWIL